jgi:phosphatidylglycerophosphate synthase
VTEAAGQADKPDEILQLSDRYFFRPVGTLLARGAATLHFSPSQLTLLAALVGILGGAFLVSLRFGWLGFALLILHGTLDSADGELARRMDRTSETGRVLDGLAGYATHLAIFVALATAHIARGGGGLILPVALLAAVMTIAHAQAYDYYRTAYAAVVNSRALWRSEPLKTGGWLRPLYAAYTRVQHFLFASHERLGRECQRQSEFTQEERARYRRTFRPLVRGWNLLGDNSRFYAAGLAVLLQVPILFFAIILLPMNLIFLAMIFWQRRADRVFLERL